MDDQYCGKPANRSAGGYRCQPDRGGASLPQYGGRSGAARRRASRAADAGSVGGHLVKVIRLGLLATVIGTLIAAAALPAAALVGRAASSAGLSFEDLPSELRVAADPQLTTVYA